MASARKPLTAVRLDRTLDSRHLRSRHTIRGGAVESIWQSGVLDPQGPIGAAERLILINATAIMLAVIVPVIVLTQIGRASCRERVESAGGAVALRGNGEGESGRGRMSAASV